MPVAPEHYNFQIGLIALWGLVGQRQAFVVLVGYMKVCDHRCNFLEFSAWRFCSLVKRGEQKSMRSGLSHMLLLAIGVVFRTQKNHLGWFQMILDIA